MSEKRFTFVCDDENCRFKDNGKTIDCVEVVGLLNKLYEENEQLRQEVVHLKDDLQYYKTKSARLEEELLNTRGCMYE